MRIFDACGTRLGRAPAARLRADRASGTGHRSPAGPPDHWGPSRCRVNHVEEPVESERELAERATGLGPTREWHTPLPGVGPPLRLDFIDSSSSPVTAIRLPSTPTPRRTADGRDRRQTLDRQSLSDPRRSGCSAPARSSRSSEHQLVALLESSRVLVVDHLSLPTPWSLCLLLLLSLVSLSSLKMSNSRSSEPQLVALLESRS